MIASRWMMASLLLLGVGWQAIMGETRVDGLIPGALLVAAGLAMLAVSLRRLPKLKVASMVVTIALATGFGALLLVDLLARVQELRWLNAVIGTAVQMFGIDTTMHDGRVLAHVDTAVLDWRPGLPRLAAFPFGIVLLGLIGAALHFPLRQGLRWLLLSVAALAAVFLLRGVLLAAVRLSLPDQGVETSTLFVLLTCLPFVLLAARPIEFGEQTRGGPLFQPVAIFALAAFAVIALRFEDIGEPGQGRVLFSDIHGRWEPTDLPFDTENFGRQNAYSYGNMYDLLGRYFDTSRITEGRLTAERLADVDVLIMKTPTEPYTPEEISLVEAFVTDGGGLLLIGDHTDLFGMSTYMNRLSSRFGIRFRADDTFSLYDEGPSTWQRPAFLPHPIVSGIEAFDFETSCSLEVPANARIVMAGHALGAEMADYNNPGFFGNIHLDLNDRLGFFPQVAALDHGKGRVVAFADSTPFSNFSLFFPGRWELALASVQFLNHDPGRLSAVRLWSALAALAALLGCLILRRGPDPVNAAAMLLGGAVGAMVVGAAQGEPMMPEAQTEVPVVAFDRGISAGAYPPSLNTDPSIANSAFDTLFTSVQRLGYQPLMTRDIDQAMDRADLIVMLYPVETLDEDAQNRLLAYVSRGGSLLVADSLVNRSSQANALLQMFGLQIGVEMAEITPQPVIPTPGARPKRLGRPVLSVMGGYPVLVDDEGRSLYAEAEIGNGMVGALAESTALSRGGLGNRFYDTPNEEQQERYNVAFMLLERGVKGGD